MFWTNGASRIISSDWMPQVLQEELSQEVRIKGDISARLCSKV